MNTYFIPNNSTIPIISIVPEIIPQGIYTIIAVKFYNTSSTPLAIPSNTILVIIPFLHQTHRTQFRTINQTENSIKMNQSYIYYKNLSWRHHRHINKVHHNKGPQIYHSETRNRPYIPTHWVNPRSGLYKDPYNRSNEYPNNYHHKRKITSSTCSSPFTSKLYKIYTT